MSDWQSWAGGGAIATLVGGVLGAWQILRTGHTDRRQAALTDRDTLLKRYRDALDDSDKENERKDARIDALDDRVRSLQNELFNVQEERRHEKQQHAAELAEVREQLAAMTTHVEQMQARLGILPEPNGEPQ